MSTILSRLTTTRIAWRALTAAIAAVAAVTGSFAYAGLSDGFLVEPASTFVVDATPAIVVNAVLETLGSLAAPASFLLALVLAVAVLTVLVLLALEVEAYADAQYLAVPLTAGAVWFASALATGNPIAATAAAVPAAAVVGVVSVAAAHDPLSVRRDRTVDRNRRATLQTGFATLSATGIGYVVGRRRTPDSSVPYLDGGISPPSEEQSLLTRAENGAFDLPDAPGLVSRIGEFYTIDINTIDPVLERDDWELSVTGLVDDELTIDYEDLRDRDADRFYSTLRCVGEDLNDREMDTAVWTGVPVADLLAEATPAGEAGHVVAHAVDGFWNTITLEELERSYLVYGMNGRVLPREHGHPVRLIVPGNWGEVNVKWITELELVAEDRDGYWEERGWDGTGEVEAVAKIWSVDRDGGAVTVGGHAYGGLAGIDAVEVSIDGGETWTEADLSLEPDGESEFRDAWRQWRHSFEPSEGSHDVVVRAIDGSGGRQIEEPSGSRPDGPTGWVSRTIEE
ncbi:molybdopterin-dependent oxidoreductase [Natrarchaeobius sp. A-rgal3]|uniref:molybdopterin-dependent oxidoreductase n=1 Tax=Natrarchaeobius versutus TaxID=1679078 RepID=UPI00350FEC68